MARGEKSGALHGLVCSHDQQLCFLFSGRKEGCVVGMDEIAVMSCTFLLVLLCHKHGGILDFQIELCDTGAASEIAEAGILCIQGRLSIFGNRQI